MADDAGRIEALYDLDGVAWAEQQAEALRRRAEPDALDWENLAEEIEDVGKSITRACRSCIDRIIEHLLKLEFAAPAMLERDQRGWRASVRSHRYRLERELTPTLRTRLPEALVESTTQQARILLEEDLIEEGEAVVARLRDGYSWSQLTDDDWWPERR